MAISPKAKRFIEEYPIDLNATRAAMRAGYSEKTAHSQGQRLLKNVDVQNAIREMKEQRSERTKIDADYVLTRLSEVDQMDAIDILNEDGTVKKIHDWPKIWRQMISGLDVTELAGGDDDKRIAVVKKIKWPDKVKNLELIGRHVVVQAFKDNIGHSGNISLADALREAREKRKGGK